MFSANWPQRSLSEVFEFLKCIKTLLRSKNAVCMIAVPLGSIDEKLRTLINKACDLIILASNDDGVNNIRIYKAPKPLNIQPIFLFSITEAQGSTLIKPVLV